MTALFSPSVYSGTSGFHPLPKPPTRKQQKARRDREDTEKLIELHNIVRDRAMEIVDGVERYRCHHCGNLFARDETCADHFPKGRRHRATRYDPDECVCSCGPCNVSNSPNRLRSLKNLGL